MNMYLHFSETIFYAIIGTLFKNLIRNFPYTQYLAYLLLMLTSVIIFFKNVTILYSEVFDIGLFCIFRIIPILS